MFPLVIKLAKGESLALVPMYLGSHFYRLDECVGYIMKFVARYHVVIHADTTFLKLFL